MSTKLKPAAASAWIAGSTMAILGGPSALAQQQADSSRPPRSRADSSRKSSLRLNGARAACRTRRSRSPRSRADLLTDRGITDFAGVAKTSPSMSFTPYPSSNNTLILYMRGQGASDAAQITLDSAVGLYRTASTSRAAQAVTFDLSDIERVEVLRGPQGTLYGRNTTGGAVNMISKKPTGELGFKQELGFGSEGRLRSLSVLDLPQIGGLSTKVSFLKREQDGFVENKGGGSNDFSEEGQTAGRVALRWDNGSPFTADFFYEIGEMTGTRRLLHERRAELRPGLPQQRPAGRRIVSRVRPRRERGRLPEHGAHADVGCQRRADAQVADRLSRRQEHFLPGLRGFVPGQLPHPRRCPLPPVLAGAAGAGQPVQRPRRLPSRSVLLQGGRQPLRERPDQGHPGLRLRPAAAARQGSRRARGSRVEGSLRAVHVDAADPRRQARAHFGGRYTKDTREASRTLQNRFRLLDPAGPNYGLGAVLRFRDGISRTAIS